MPTVAAQRLDCDLCHPEIHQGCGEIHRRCNDHRYSPKEALVAAAPKTRKVRIQDLKPGMKVEQVDADLDFVYVEVEKVELLRSSYLVTFVGTEYRPIRVRPRQSVTVLDEA